jgi:predicted NBD/HSP70 family sugar kinase
VTMATGGVSAARPGLIRALNEQILLGHIRDHAPVSRAELARFSGLSKPTVSLALDNLEAGGLVRRAGERTGLPGRAARLYEVRPEAGFVLGLDIGRRYLRGAVMDIGGMVRAKASTKVSAANAPRRIAELVDLGTSLCREAGLELASVTQTVVGSPGVYDPGSDVIRLAGNLPGWDRPGVLTQLRKALGQDLMLENDIDMSALAERAHGHGQEVEDFAFVSVGTGLGMGLVLGGRLHRGAHGVAGEIGFLPLTDGDGDPRDARRRGSMESAASAAGVVRAARRAGMRGPVSAVRVFEAAARGDERARCVVAHEATLIAKAICSVVTVVDPQMIVLGGGIGQAPGFAEAVTGELHTLAPAFPEVRVSALGTDAVVDGCLAAGLDRAWKTLTAALPGTPA